MMRRSLGGIAQAALLTALVGGVALPPRVAADEPGSEVEPPYDAATEAALEEAPESAPEAALGTTVPEGEAYVYPEVPDEATTTPDGVWRYPAAAVDLLLVRPAMVAGLAGGAALFVATLPFSAATLTTDDALAALGEQAESTFVRPLGEF
jgi:hypothetical protein